MLSSGLLKNVYYIVINPSKPRITTCRSIKAKNLSDQMSSIIFNNCGRIKELVRFGCGGDEGRQRKSWRAVMWLLGDWLLVLSPLKVFSAENERKKMCRPGCPRTPDPPASASFSKSYRPAPPEPARNLAVKILVSIELQ